jgi:hypothetical protein
VKVDVPNSVTYPLLANQAFRLQSELAARDAGRDIALRVVSAAFRIRGSLDAGRCARALAVVFGRHEAMRARIVEKSGRPFQLIDDTLTIPVEMPDLAEPYTDAATGSWEGAIASRLSPFDVNNGPLARACLARLGQDEHALLIAVDHLVCDGFSMATLLLELGGAYSDIEAPSVSVPSYTRYLERKLDDAERETREAAALLARSSPLVPTSAAALQRRPPSPVGRPLGPAGVVRFRLPAVLLRHARASAAKRHMTPFILLFAAFGSVWLEMSGQHRATFSSTVANRQDAGTENLVGLLANSILLTFDAGQGTGPDEVLNQARTGLAAGLADEGIPIGTIVRLAHPHEYRWGRAPYVPFEYLSAELAQALSTLPLCELSVDPLDVPDLENQHTPPPSVGVGVGISETPRGLDISIRFDSLEIDRLLVRRLADLYLDRIVTFVRADTRA